MTYYYHRENFSANAIAANGLQRLLKRHLREPKRESVPRAAHGKLPDRTRFQRRQNSPAPVDVLRYEKWQAPSGACHFRRCEDPAVNPTTLSDQKVNRVPNWNWRGVLLSAEICPNGVLL
jgi:hypothetical protein